MSNNNTTCDDKTVFVGVSTTAKDCVDELEDKTVFVVEHQAQASEDKTVFMGGQKDSGSVAAETDTVATLNNRFELKELLGAGGMGAVYRAVDQRKVEANDRDHSVAIKVLNSDFQKHPHAFISLQREARKSQQLAHPSIVTVYDFDRDGDTVFMTMEYMEGEPLDELLQREMGHGLGLEAGCRILRSISNALIYAHNNHIIHADFKPGNIFVTSDGGSKVFDFGIARAVSSQGVLKGTGVTTLFDAATLGALTPAYASYEMLLGLEPSTDDDLYALACVAYELFAGVHPFGKLPANEAKEKNLKPERIKCLSRRQWRALSKALSFERGKRTATVEEFAHQFFSTGNSWIIGAVTVAVLAVSGGVYQSVTSVDTEVLRSDIEADMSHKFEQKLAHDKLKGLLNAKELTLVWDKEIESQLKRYAKAFPDDTAFPLSVRSDLMTLYLDAVAQRLNKGELQQAEEYIARSESWGATILAQEAREQLTAKRRIELQRMEAKKQAAQYQLAMAEEKKLKDEALLQREQQEQERIRLQRISRERLASALLTVDKSLNCQGLDINGRLAEAVGKLAALSKKSYEQHRNSYASSLLKCIRSKELESADVSNKWLVQSRQLFPDSVELAQAKIDSCLHLNPGSGGRSNRLVCRDSFQQGGESPVMVVVADGGKRFAIGKYEVSNAEYNHFCRQAGCPRRPDNNRPVTGVSLVEIKRYLAWLTSESGFKYSLPSYEHWLVAAKGRSKPADPDRNCFLKYAGIEKGFELIPISTGKRNGYGLVNAVGNAQELVLRGGKLWAAGGSRKDPMSECLVTTRRAHTGVADEVTGFRVARAVN
ncbi:serine/threonine protein kinase [Sinobacterium caligoides]|uniref:Serine/threonine protein kinase n=1 Tax=Sinobacterium caligoides TaxID=933926 RepID=A0A3N2DJQ1_9GAMM|nr:protein kinase [Sinobacterium caligoides]ROS00033.1 serine/threonine protein kinase [Sinobacterium caligoides]